MNANVNERDKGVGFLFLTIGIIGTLAIPTTLLIKTKKQLPIKYTKTLAFLFFVCITLIILGSLFLTELLSIY
jgi:CHASE2 domain-containing sensor protein